MFRAAEALQTIILINLIIVIIEVYSIIFIMLIILCMQADWHVPYRVSVQKQDWQPIVHSQSEVVYYGSCIWILIWMMMMMMNNPRT